MVGEISKMVGAEPLVVRMVGDRRKVSESHFEPNHWPRKTNTVVSVKWWVIVDSNHWPLPCHRSALTN